jgi:hypothetical protein
VGFLVLDEAASAALSSVRSITRAAFFCALRGPLTRPGSKAGLGGGLVPDMIIVGFQIQARKRHRHIRKIIKEYSLQWVFFEGGCARN